MKSKEQKLKKVQPEVKQRHEPCDCPQPAGGTFIYELDDLILSRIIPLEAMEKNLTQKKYLAVRGKIEELMRSDKVLDILKKKLPGLLDNLPKLSDFFPGVAGGAYFEGPDTLISRLLGRDVSFQITPTQTRILTAIVKQELLDSEEIIGLLRDEAKPFL